MVPSKTGAIGSMVTDSSTDSNANRGISILLLKDSYSLLSPNDEEVVVMEGKLLVLFSFPSLRRLVARFVHFCLLSSSVYIGFRARGASKRIEKCF